MKKLFYYIWIAVLATACNDFVDIVPKGNTIPETVDDLAKMMNNSTQTTDWKTSDVLYSVSNAVTLYSDDYTVTEDPASSSYTSLKNSQRNINVCSWADYIYNETEDDPDWNGLYKSNYVLNYILDKIDLVEEGASAKRSEVKGQALVHRAMNYFLLVNLYGKQYDAATAAEDLAVPLVLKSDINKQYPRATVAKVYEQIFTDLNEAITILETDMPKYSHIPGRAAAYALRARVYLWQQNYDQAYRDVCEALKIRNKLIDYNTLSLISPERGPVYGVNNYEEIPSINMEELYSRIYRSNYMSSNIYSPGMLAIIDENNDLRYKMFIGTFSSLVYSTLFTRIHHSGITTAEVWLMKAETALRKTQPDISEAIEALDVVRIHRYAADTYQRTTITDKNLLLTEILNERRRELIYTEMTFLDRKRLNADPATARPMTRTIYGKSYTLPVGDPRYQLAIPLNVMELNPLLTQNER